MATLEEIKAQCESFQANQLPLIQKIEAAYFISNGRYFQGIQTPSTIPDDGLEIDADYSKKPTDQKETWADVFKDLDALPMKIPALTAIHVYEGPNGHGFIVSLAFHSKGKVYYRMWNQGPENRDTSWIEVDYDPEIYPPLG